MSGATLPIDDNRHPIQLAPARVALEETYDTTVSASTEITLNTSTTYIEVTAIDKGIFLKWGTSDVSSTDFDEFIVANTTRRYYLPPDITAVNVIEEAATAKLVLTEK